MAHAEMMMRFQKEPEIPYKCYATKNKTQLDGRLKIENICVTSFMHEAWEVPRSREGES